MDKEKEIEEIKALLKNAIDKIAKYFQEEVKIALGKGAKHLSRSECEKSLYDFEAEELISAGYGNVKQAVKEFADKLKEKAYQMSDSARIFFTAIIDDLFKELYGEE